MAAGALLVLTPFVAGAGTGADVGTGVSDMGFSSFVVPPAADPPSSHAGLTF